MDGHPELYGREKIDMTEKQAAQNSISNEGKLRLVMAKDWWETDDLDGKIGKVKVSDGPLGLRCLAVTDSWANDKALDGDY